MDRHASMRQHGCKLHTGASYADRLQVYDKPANSREARAASFSLLTLGRLLLGGAIESTADKQMNTAFARLTRPIVRLSIVRNAKVRCRASLRPQKIPSGRDPVVKRAMPSSLDRLRGSADLRPARSHDSSPPHSAPSQMVRADSRPLEQDCWFSGLQQFLVAKATGGQRKPV